MPVLRWDILRRMQDALLVMETSCTRPSAVLRAGENLLGAVEWVAERNHAAAIFGALQRLLPALEGHRLAEIVVGSGPGSYGGVRVALAVADGFALVHGARVAAFGSWNGLGVDDAEALVISDARRGGWAWGRLCGGLLDGEPEVLPADRTMERIGECRQAGLPVYSTETAEALSAKGMEGVRPVQPGAEALARAWCALPGDRRESLLSGTAEPLYVRAPHITCAKRPAWAVKA